MGVHNKFQVLQGEVLHNVNGPTRWTAISDSFIEHGKSYVIAHCICGTERKLRVASVLSGTYKGCGHCVALDRRTVVHIGDKLGCWTILDIKRDRCGLHVYAQCACGRSGWRNYPNLKRKKNSCCKVCAPKKLIKSDMSTRILLRIWKKAMPWLTHSVANFLSKQLCFYCGAPPANLATVKRKTFENLPVVYQGVDEVVYGAGHVTGNILPCCINCNKVKNDSSLDVFCEWWNRKRSPEHQFTVALLTEAAAEFGHKLEVVH
jgi:hypothetical protein